MPAVTRSQTRMMSHIPHYLEEQMEINKIARAGFMFLLLFVGFIALIMPEIIEAFSMLTPFQLYLTILATIVIFNLESQYLTI